MNDRYATAEESQSVMKKTPETRDERFVREAMEERSDGLDHGDTDYHRLAVDLAGALHAAVHQRAELLTALKLLTVKGTRQETGLGWNVRLRMARELIAKVEGGAA